MFPLLEIIPDIDYLSRIMLCIISSHGMKALLQVLTYSTPGASYWFIIAMFNQFHKTTWLVIVHVGPCPNPKPKSWCRPMRNTIEAGL